MKIADVRITANGHGKNAQVWLDRQNISHAVYNLNVDVNASDVPRVTLSLVAVPLVLDLDNAQVAVDKTTEDLLVKLGWTPPSEDGHQIIIQGREQCSRVFAVPGFVDALKVNTKAELEEADNG